MFTLSFQGDYFLNSQFSVGPQLLFSPGGDLTQITFAGIGRYHIPVGAVSIIPFGGLGFVYADLEQGRRDDGDVSYIFHSGQLQPSRSVGPCPWPAPSLSPSRILIYRTG
ncbi:MAG: hypothetical protein CO149_05435 [Nitrospirae bacterium CG_4_9_14_3_um_filter_51_5]|nr:MAG: hypothetical protein CO149_05435 [Nitrospirae bacterium CG_4_9_14_3_um_filter_51_5]